MGHHHSHPQPEKNLRLAFFLNLGFTILEIAGGLYTNSIAILSDALHDLGDSIALGISYFLERKSKKGGDSKYSFGYRRFSLLGALLNSILLLVGAGIVLWHAVPRIFNPQPTKVEGMIILALIGIAVNGFAFLKLRKTSSLNMKAAALHLLEDVMGWMAVLVVSIVLLFWKAFVLDALLSIGITLFILYNVVRNLRHTLKIFLQGVPEHLDIRQIENIINSIPKVISTHHTHIWTMDGEHHILTSHIVVADGTSKEDVFRIKEKTREAMTQLKIDHLTLEVEFPEEDCLMREEHCGEAHSH
ncbi:MAG: cation diffusion facilitator family transporter [Bacteroidia bacterium]